MMLAPALKASDASLAKLHLRTGAHQELGHRTGNRSGRTTTALHVGAVVTPDTTTPTQNQNQEIGMGLDTAQLFFGGVLY
jgi:hypothetical protein